MNPLITYNPMPAPNIAEWGAFYDEETQCIALMLQPELYKENVEQWIPAESFMDDIYEGGAVRIYRCAETGHIITMDDDKRYIIWPILSAAEWLNFRRWPAFGFPMDTIQCYSQEDIERMEEYICTQRYTPQLVTDQQVQQETVEAHREIPTPSLSPSPSISKKDKSIHINIRNLASTGKSKKSSAPAAAMVVPVPPDPIPSAPPMPSLPPAVVQTMIQHAIMTNATCPLTELSLQTQQPHMIAVTSCGHVFYKPAIKKWLFRDANCPCCQVYCQLHE
jgi:hypothetical protein